VKAREAYGGFKKAERSADFPVRSNLGTFNASKKLRDAPLLYAAADWKVRAPFLNAP